MSNKTTAQPVMEAGGTEERVGLTADPTSNVKHGKNELMEEIQSLNDDINKADENIAFHHREKENAEELKKTLITRREFFVSELREHLGEPKGTNPPPREQPRKQE